jgi:uncharacterized Fe-S cluster-containing radical SAM superfamily enzyme
MTKKTEFEKFMTQAIKGKKVQVSFDGIWEDLYFPHETIKELRGNHSDGRLRIKPNSVVIVENKIHELKQKLYRMNND